MIIQVTKSNGESLSNRRDVRPTFSSKKERMEYLIRKLRDDAKGGGSDKSPSSLIGSRFVFYKLHDDGTWDTVTYILEKTTTDQDIIDLINYVYENF